MLRGEYCSEINCTKPVHSRGLCGTHYQRWHKYESEGKIVKGWGDRRKHPLYDTWRTLNRKVKSSVCPEWVEFFTFAEDVGERPSPYHRIERFDAEKPYSKENCFWRELTSTRYEHETRKERAARYARERRTYCPDKGKDYRLRSTFGITLDDYSSILADQGGKCAICGAEEKDEVEVGRKIAKLCVDHCHKTNVIRGILCHNCNRSIGLLKDNPDILEKAASYLRNPPNKRVFIRVAKRSNGRPKNDTKGAVQRMINYVNANYRHIK